MNTCRSRLSFSILRYLLILAWQTPSVAQVEIIKMQRYCNYLSFQQQNPSESNVDEEKNSNSVDSSYLSSFDQTPSTSKSPSTSTKGVSTVIPTSNPPSTFIQTLSIAHPPSRSFTSPSSKTTTPSTKDSIHRTRPTILKSKSYIISQEETATQPVCVTTYYV